MIKAVKDRDGNLCGISGSITVASAYLKWFSEGKYQGHPEPPLHYNGSEDFQCNIILVDKTGVTWGDKAGRARYKAPFYVAGSGSNWAIAALEAGASAREAVRIACKFDENSGGQIRVLKFGKGSKA